MSLSITFTENALADHASLQDVMLSLFDRTFRVEFMVDNHPKGVLGLVVGASNTELIISTGGMRHYIPWGDITVLEYQ